MHAQTTAAIYNVNRDVRRCPQPIEAHEFGPGLRKIARAVEPLLLADPVAQADLLREKLFPGAARAEAERQAKATQ